VHDYIRTILGTSQSSDFFLDPFKMPAYPVYGNQVSIEFNIIYRWHAAIGKQDEDWLNTVMNTLGPSLRYQMGHAAPAPADVVVEQKQQQQQQQPGKPGDGDPNGTDQGTFDALLPLFNEHFVHATEEELEKGLPVAGAHRDVKTGVFDNTDLAKLLRRGYDQVASDLG
jgi:hypothetical protein